MAIGHKKIGFKVQRQMSTSKYPICICITTNAARSGFKIKYPFCHGAVVKEFSGQIQFHLNTKKNSNSKDTKSHQGIHENVPLPFCTYDYLDINAYKS